MAQNGKIRKEYPICEKNPPNLTASDMISAGLDGTGAVAPASKSPTLLVLAGLLHLGAVVCGA